MSGGFFVDFCQCISAADRKWMSRAFQGLSEAPPRQGRRLVLRFEVEALLREPEAFEAFEQKWEQAVPAEDTTPLTDEEANAIVHEVWRARDNSSDL
jgi:hypothetical protein